MPLTRPWHKLHSILLWLLAAISAIGLANSVYLTITHYSNTLVPCSFSHGCETVLRSQYAVVLGVPVAIYGVIFYLVTFVAAVYFVTNKQYHWWLSIWALAGFCSTLYLIFVQAVILKAFCQYCLVSTFTSSITFIITTVLYYIYKEKPHGHKET